MKKLTELELGEITARIGTMNRTDRTSVQKFYAGDHWQSQAAYVGPLALESDGTTSTAGMETIQSKFVFENMIAGIVNRHVAGVLGETAHWQVTPKKPSGENGKPSEAEKKIVDELEQDLTTWLDKRTNDYASDEDKLPPLQKFCIDLLLYDRAIMRIFVPSSTNGTVSAGTMEEALDKLYFQCPDITQSGVLTDKNTQEKIGAYFWSDAETNYEETTWQENGVTFLRTVTNGQEAITQHKMRGQLFIFEARRARFVKESILSLQKTLNMVLTMLGRNVHVGGSPETFFLNALLPGKTQIVNGAPQHVADPVQTGASSIISVSGIPVMDPTTGERSFTNPNIIFRDPVPVDTFTNSYDALCRCILEEAQQLHALISGDASVSGESRVQALADFENSLKETARAINAMLQWLLESAISLAAAISGNDASFDDYRVTAQCNINAGPLSAEMLRTIADAKDRNFFSHETALSLARVQDVEAEIQRVEMEKQEEMNRQQDANGVAAQQTQSVLSALRQPRNQTNTSEQNGAVS